MGGCHSFYILLFVFLFTGFEVKICILLNLVVEFVNILSQKAIFHKEKYET